MADAIPAVAPEAAATAKNEPAGKGGSKKKLLIIVAAAVVALGAAGGGAYFFMSKGDSHEAAADGEKAEGKDQGKGKAKGKNAKEAAPKGPAIYVEFDPPFVVNFEAKGVMRFLQVSIQVMTRDPETAELIKQHDPKLRNDLLMLLGSQTHETISTLEGKERLRNDALQTVAKVIVAEGGKAKSVEQVYFTSFIMQ